MSPIAQDICQELLDHHRWVCEQFAPEQRHLQDCVVTYGNLCERAGHPGIAIGVGKYLGEIAAWCHANGWPPLNSLAVNEESQQPGDSYNLARGCSLLRWPDEAARCLRFEGYPQEVPAV